MRTAILLFAAVLAIQVPRGSETPFIAIGVGYAGRGALPPATRAEGIDTLKDDLSLIRRAGFNAVTTWITWREAEPERGSRSLAALERVTATAATLDLKAAVVALTTPAPDWARTDSNAPRAFIDYLSRRMALQPAVVNVSSGDRSPEGLPGRIDVKPGAASEARLAMWAELANGTRFITFLGAEEPLSADVLSLGETAGVVTRNQALFGPLRPRPGGVVNIDAADAPRPLEVRLLESTHAIVIVGLNHAGVLRKATITFPPDIPEAIWQNLETGTAVSFVMSELGPVLEHTFAPRDALVLMIRKTLR